jgi:hypothetical protein
MGPSQDELSRHGFLLLAFDLLVAAVVASVVGIMFPSAFVTGTTIVLAAGGVLSVMAARVVEARSSQRPA